MFRSAILFFSLTALTCQSQHHEVAVSKADYTIIAHQASDSIFVNATTAILSDEEIVAIEKLLKLELGKKLKKGQYFRQYVAVKNQNDEKIVWINFLCKKYYEPVMQIQIAPLGSGDCFFELKVNLTQKNLFDFREN